MKLIIFDVDGTLVDSAALIMKAQLQTFEAFGIAHPGREAGLGVIGLSLPEALRVLAGDAGPINDMALHYKRLFGALRADPANDEPLFPGAADAVKQLAARRDVKLAIATGKSRRGVAQFLEKHHWRRHFSAIRTADDCPSKPDPAMIDECIAELGADRRATMMIGDSSFDMAMARAAGVRAIGVAWGFQPTDNLRKAGAHRILESTAEISALVEAGAWT